MSAQARIVLAIVLSSAAVMLTVGAIGALGETVWQEDGVAVCDEDKVQSDPALVSDGNNGAIVTWVDRRDDDYGVYAQRMDSSGNAQWVTDGISVAVPSVFNLNDPRIAPDGSGGAVVAWHRIGAVWDVYAQRVYSDGTPAWSWAPIGVSLCVESGTQLHSQIASDGAGGGIVAWEDYRSGSESDVYAQRVDYSGVTAWTDDGVSVCVAAEDQEHLQITTDGAGGAIVVWEDNRGGNADIYAQRINSLGNREWISGGVAVRAASGNQSYPRIASDGAGGAIVTWQDSATWDIYAQRVYSDGTMAWTTGGVGVCTQTGIQEEPNVAPDGDGGAVLVWVDARPGSNGADLYAQRLDSEGNPHWKTDGVSLTSAADQQYTPRIASDGSGGAVVTWWDYRDGASTNIDVYAQRVDASGNIAWQTDGVTVCAASERQDYPQIVTDGRLGSIIAWEDSRGDDDDIYAQRVRNLEVVNLPLVAKNF